MKRRAKASQEIGREGSTAKSNISRLMIKDSEDKDRI